MSVMFLNMLWQVSTLALVTLGLAIIFGQLRIMNMAHGEFVMLGAYAPAMTASLGLSPWLQLPMCIVSVGLCAWLIEVLVVRHLYGRLFGSLLATWGISLLLREVIELIFGRGYQSVELPISTTFTILGVEYPGYRIVVIAGIFTLFIGLWWWYRRSRVGTEIKAMVDNPELAQAIGINTASLSRKSFIFGCIAAGIAGLVLAPTVRIEPVMGIDYLVRSFFALVVGGLGSLEGLLIGTGLIGGSQSLLGAWFSQTTAYLFILCLSILFLWLKPNGLHRHH